MITGEHAVLHGKHAIVGAVNQRVYVSIQPRGDALITINSELGKRQMSRKHIDSSKPFNFLGAIFEKYNEQLKNGFDIIIESDFSSKVGLASSSAITVATIAALETWINGEFPDRNSLMIDAIDIICKVQGRGSGADVAAAVWGGVLLYKSIPQVISRHENLPPISLVYAGYKTPTPEVITIVEEQRKKTEDNYRDLYNRIDQSSLDADKALTNNDWPALGNALKIGQSLMEELGVCDKALKDISETMNKMPNIYAAKISGSGLGDCILGIGNLDDIEWNYQVIPVALSKDGVKLEDS